MISKEEFGSLVAEYEGFRDTIFDSISELKEELERTREDMKELQKQVDKISKKVF